MKNKIKGKKTSPKKPQLFLLLLILALLLVSLVIIFFDFRVDRKDLLPKIMDQFIFKSYKKFESVVVAKSKVAFAITITKDGVFLDGAAVLAYSIIESMKNQPYQFSLIAFVHPTVTHARPILRNLGFHVIEATTPINVSAIPHKFLREKINKNGCCGASELIKLNAYRLLQYKKVVHLDADTILTGPITDLFENSYSLLYTTDPAMATWKEEHRQPVQGGFIILQPSLKDFTSMVDIVMTTPFHEGSAWNGSKIGWFWGGMTVQGLLPYYYNAVTQPGRSLKLNRCIYNTMADTDECKKFSIEDIKSAHFTAECQKPWMCMKNHFNPLCGRLHEKWLDLRNKSLIFYGIKSNDTCVLGGSKHYVQLSLEDVKFPYVEGFVPDDSPDILEPTVESRYITKNYDTFVGGKFSSPN